MALVRATALFAVTALAEIVGCYLFYLVIRKDKSALLLLAGTLCLALFAWLLTFHPTGAGRTYAAYGGVYVAAAMAWLWMVEGTRPSVWDAVGSIVAITGMAIIVAGHRGSL